MKKSSWLIICSVIFLLGACTSTNMLVLKVENPAPITLPNNINNIVIVNNYAQQPDSVGHVEYIKGYVTNNKINVSCDSADIILMQTLLNNLTATNYFNNVTLYGDPIREDNNFDKEIELSTERIKEIAESTNSDAVISLNKVIFETQSDSLPANYYHYFESVYNTLDLKIGTLFRIYSEKGDPISPPFVITDSISWIETIDPISRERLSDPLPEREDAVKAAAAYIADRISKSLVPYWSDEVRLFYGDAKDAKKKADENKWGEARAIWLKEYEKENKSKRKARLANNIALTYELEDNLKEALKWAQTAHDLFAEDQLTSIDKENLDRAETYKQILIQRINDFRILDLRNNK
jgi:hypothetical protein